VIPLQIITHYTANVFNNQVETDVAKVSRFMARRGVSKELRREIERNLRYRFRMEQQMLNPEIFSRFSPALQRELNMELLKDVILCFPLFKHGQLAFVAEIARAFVLVQCLPGDVIVEDGQVVQELVFIVRGHLNVTTCMSGQRDRWTSAGVSARQSRLPSAWNREMHAGSWFGEECLFRRPDTGAEEYESEFDDGPESLAPVAAQMPEHHSSRVSRVSRVSSCAASSGCGAVLSSLGSGGARKGSLIHKSLSITACYEAELAVLTAVDYWEICKKFPRSMRKHEGVCRALKSGRISMEMFRCHSVPW